MKVTFSSVKLPPAGAIVLFTLPGKKLEGLARGADAACHGHIARAITAARFESGKSQVLDLLVPFGGALRRVILVGLGDFDKLQLRDLELAGGNAAGALAAAKAGEASIAADMMLPKGLDPAEAAAFVASGIRLRTYAFAKYKSKKPSEPATLDQVRVLCAAPAKAARRFAICDTVVDGVHLARDLVNEPANHLTPVAFADRVRALAKTGLKIELLAPRDMTRLGMGALLGVAKGSANEARVVVMRWNGGRKRLPALAFVGKGVTFDSGGISMKPASGMEDMKGDMGGAACVVGLMHALAVRKARVNAVGVIGLVENMPSGTAQRPGDVVKSMSGKTVAVLNTDAEGRLVLADLLWYTQKRFKPKFMINLATLTGAILIALGKEHAGLFCNNDELAGRILAAGIETGEKLWRMPLAEEYDRLIDSDIADVKNIGGRNAGAITGAQFLQRFVNSVPWAHIDIAGTAMDSVKSPINQSWGSGWGVRLLDRLVATHYEP
jgi:leucyl aminopeptidase